MPQKKILVLGSGLVAKPCVDYLVRDVHNDLTIGEPTYTHLRVIQLICCV